MTNYGDRVLDDAMAQGRANAVTIEMARRHCTLMTFAECGGRGMAEAMSGLPINTRRVHCPYAQGNSMAMNLDWIASNFYEENCVGCEYRQPTGEVPNLASIIEERKAEAADAADAQRHIVERRHDEWGQRSARRQPLLATADPAMAQAIEDIGILDIEPGGVIDDEVATAALRRLTALAERGPETFTGEVIEFAVQLVEEAGITALLGPLRHLSRTQDHVGAVVLGAAVTTLRRSVNIEAGRCIADLRQHLMPSSLDAAVVRSAVHLAGAPETDLLGRRRTSTANDPGALRVIADLAPTTLVAVLREMLPPPPTPSRLVVPPGGTADASSTSSDYDRASAAGAVRALATTHLGVATQLAGALVRNLGVDGNDHHDSHPIFGVIHTLATMLILGIDDVVSEVELVGQTASDELRERLFEVYEQTARLLDPDDRWREPGDARPIEDRRRALFEQLLTTCLIRAGCDWGYNTSYSAANIVETLAKMEPRWAIGHIDGILGAFLTAVGEIQDKPQPSLAVVDGTPPMVLAMEDYTRRNSHSATARELLNAVEHMGDVDVTAVCSAVGALIVEERGSERGVDVVWRLLPLFGKIGRSHGQEPGVLRLILPTLYTYILDREPALRAAALDAWVNIASAHTIPSSLADLLPVLLADRYVYVIQSMLGAARRLTWNDDDRISLLVFAVNVCRYIDAREETDTLKSAMTTVDVLSRGNERLRAFGEELLLQRAADLDGYDLRNALRRTWLPESEHSGDMAYMRLAQARDPRINDRFNAGDDDQLCALLDCGSGLLTLDVNQLIDAALDLAPDYPVGSAEFVEVAWRAGRLSDAVAIVSAVTEATPNVPAFDRQRAIAQLLFHASEFDVVADGGYDLDAPANALAVDIGALADQDSEELVTLLRQVLVRVRIRYLLRGAELPSVYSADQIPENVGNQRPAQAARLRADLLASCAAELTELSQRLTATSAYVRAFAGLCEVGAHLLRLDAAELDADTAVVDASTTAARRHTAILEAELPTQFAPDDPLAGRLADALASVKDINKGEQVAAALISWAALPLPLLIVRGPRRLAHMPPTDAGVDTEKSEQPVAVVLASVDGQLITGPQVLRPNFVYDLRIDVRPGVWPEWADRLDVELLSHLSDVEVETPAFSWQRPSDFDEDSQISGNGTLLLRFGLTAGQPAPPFLVNVRWRGTRDGNAVSEAVDVAGHRQLRFRPFDASRDYLTDFPVFDERLLGLYESLHQASYDEDHIQAFCRLFTSVCRAGLTMTWDKKYKRGTHVSERDFHDDLYSRLQSEPELGGRLERGTPLALGFLDVRHDGVTAELKVERRTPVSQATAPKYMGQPTQYAAADGVRLSILCVLDMSPKSVPVGTPENYMFTLQPALHGLDNPEAPSLVAVIVVNGNVPTPSSWSRRKTAVQPVQPA